MSSDTLATLLRIRQIGLEEAQKALGQAFAQRQQRQARREEEEVRYAHEASVALDLAAGDEAVDAFARWMPIGRRIVSQAIEEEQIAAGEVEQARVVLSLASTACKSIERRIEERNNLRREVAGRAEQRVLDEIGGRPR